MLNIINFFKSKRLFTTDKYYYEKFIKDIDENHQPTFAQFCGHDPEILLKVINN